MSRSFFFRSIKAGFSLVLFKGVGAGRSVPSETGFSTTLSGRPIIVKTEIFHKKMDVELCSDLSEYWCRHQVPKAFSRLQTFVSQSPLFSKRISQSICPQTGNPVYENLYSSYESYLNHMKLISLVDPYSKKSLGPFQFEYRSKDFISRDEILPA